VILPHARYPFDWRHRTLSVWLQCLVSSDALLRHRACLETLSAFVVDHYGTIFPGEHVWVCKTRTDEPRLCYWGHGRLYRCMKIPFDYVLRPRFTVLFVNICLDCALFVGPSCSVCLRVAQFPHVWYVVQGGIFRDINPEIWILKLLRTYSTVVVSCQQVGTTASHCSRPHTKQLHTAAESRCSWRTIPSTLLCLTVWHIKQRTCVDCLIVSIVIWRCTVVVKFSPPFLIPPVHYTIRCGQSTCSWV